MKRLLVTASTIALLATPAHAASDGDTGIAMITVAIIGLIYIAPTIIAFRRKHHSRWAILMLNFLLGWIGLGWIFALIWSLTGVRHDAVATLSGRPS
jgi:ABC-type transport system involved in cytochrome c biogenesis permease component